MDISSPFSRRYKGSIDVSSMFIEDVALSWFVCFWSENNFTIRVSWPSVKRSFVIDVVKEKEQFWSRISEPKR